MWINDKYGRLLNTDHLLDFFLTPTDNVWAVKTSASQFYLAKGPKEEMQAVLDRIAHAIAAGGPFLDLGKAESDPFAGYSGPAPDDPSGSLGAMMNRLQARTMRVDPYVDKVNLWCASLHGRGGTCILEADGPTPDAAIANLKNTKT